MEKRNLILALILLFVGLTVILLFIYRDKIFGKGNTGNASMNNGTGSGNINTSFPLKFGSNNQYVGNLQRYLLSRNPNCLPIYGADDDWGSETESCVMSVLGVNVVDYNKYKSLGLA